jgi:hypothetical protein
MLPVILMAFGVAAAAAQGAAFEARKRFFAEVFRQTSELPLQARHEMHRPRVVCGMLLIPADPTIDPGIRILPPSRPEPKIKAIRPPVCVE